VEACGGGISTYCAVDFFRCRHKNQVAHVVAFWFAFCFAGKHADM
jgi:hypothetical protein